ncbi:unnamed protein product [Protopolystoma xenopodis]|uniref:Uncharacterized protein n=1 Tax=Protopolystoma xenopodis TaxID=117903 RepID=A0A3S4ZUX6_9PLAT|nr:unnamed protein product [Protopolystoma xenopodis]
MLSIITRQTIGAYHNLVVKMLCFRFGCLSKQSAISHLPATCMLANTGHEGLKANANATDFKPVWLAHQLSGLIIKVSQFLLDLIQAWVTLHPLLCQCPLQV